jgi:hypothetical protein
MLDPSAMYSETMGTGWSHLLHHITKLTATGKDEQIEKPVPAETLTWDATDLFANTQGTEGDVSAMVERLTNGNPIASTANLLQWLLKDMVAQHKYNKGIMSSLVERRNQHLKSISSLDQAMVNVAARMIAMKNNLSNVQAIMLSSSDKQEANLPLVKATFEEFSAYTNVDEIIEQAKQVKKVEILPPVLSINPDVNPLLVTLTVPDPLPIISEEQAKKPRKRLVVPDPLPTNVEERSKKSKKRKRQELSPIKIVPPFRPVGRQTRNSLRTAPRYFSNTRQDPILIDLVHPSDQAGVKGVDDGNEGHTDSEDDDYGHCEEGDGNEGDDNDYGNDDEEQEDEDDNDDDLNSEVDYSSFGTSENGVGIERSDTCLNVEGISNVGDDCANVEKISNVGDGGSNVGKEPLNVDEGLNVGEGTLNVGKVSNVDRETLNVGKVSNVGGETLNVDKGPNVGEATLNVGKVSNVGGETLNVGKIPNVGEATLNVGKVSNVGGETLNVGKVPNVGDGTLNVGEVSNVGDGTLNVGEASNVGDGTLNVGEVSNVGDGTSNVGEISNVGSRSSNVSENSNVGPQSSNVGQVPNVSEQTNVGGDSSNVGGELMNIGNDLLDVRTSEGSSEAGSSLAGSFVELFPDFKDEDLC